MKLLDNVHRFHDYFQNTRFIAYAFWNTMVPSKTYFVEIARQMSLAHVVKYAKFGAFQDRVKRLGGIVVSIATRKFFFTMINPIVSSKHLASFAVSLKLIRHQMRSLINKTFDVWQKVLQTVTFYRNSPNRAVALDRNQHSLLFCSTASFMDDTVLVPRFAADIFFIQFNDTAQRRNKLRTRVHHLSYRMPQFPRAFLRNSNPLGQKNRGYTLAGIGDVVHGQKPLPKREFGAMHRRFCCNGELPLTVGALVKPGACALAQQSIRLGTTAMRAVSAMSPNNGLKKSTAGRIICKPFSKLIDVHGILLNGFRGCYHGVVTDPVTAMPYYWL
jgi:hypothetical protein